MFSDRQKVKRFFLNLRLIGISLRVKLIFAFLLIMLPQLGSVFYSIITFSSVISSLPQFGFELILSDLIFRLMPSLTIMGLLLLEKRFRRIHFLTFIFSILYLLYISQMGLFTLALGASDSGNRLPISVIFYVVIVVVSAFIFLLISFIKTKDSNPQNIPAPTNPIQPLETQTPSGV